VPVVVIHIFLLWLYQRLLVHHCTEVLQKIESHESWTDFLCNLAFLRLNVEFGWLVKGNTTQHFEELAVNKVVVLFVILVLV
jgi:hypothetical protein